MSSFATLIYEKQDIIAWVTLNRPQVLNVYNMRMRDELYDVLGAIRDDLEVRVAVFKGAGDKAFCAGADLSEFLTAPSPVIARRVRWERDVWGRFLGINKPLIAALHGYVFGSGVEIALCCDIRIAADDIQMALPEAGLGIIPAAGGSQTLPRVIGTSAALDLLLTCRRINAAEALRLKLVNRVVPRSDLITAAGKLAREIAVNDPRVMSAVKQAVTGGLDLTLEQGLALERRLGQQLHA
ncbi:MAG: enoyl-CoA hydratase/isomerase family protein [Dehalococcoidales bacterium]|nr:enoyl-CoA hydratase/isomerase family protein [Dehalococcoidales bacterium]